MAGAAIAWLFLVPPAGAAPLPAGPATSPVPGMVFVTTNQLAAMQKEEDALRRENALLRKENRALRRQLVKRGQPPAVVGLATGETAPGRRDAEGGYWLSPSGKRHNPGCRYFKQGKGKPCAKGDGVPCRICGG